jgi:hypothetical protein
MISDMRLGDKPPPLGDAAGPGPDGLDHRDKRHCPQE